MSVVVTFEVKNISLVSRTALPAGETPEITSQALVEFVAVSTTQAEASVDGGFTMTTPDIGAFTVGSKYNATFVPKP
jgi:hypothetical protein